MEVSAGQKAYDKSLLDQLEIYPVGMKPIPPCFHVHAHVLSRSFQPAYESTRVAVSLTG